MHDALHVRSVKSLRNFDTDAKSLSKRQGSSPQARRQGFPLQVLHHEEIHTVVVSDVIERANARMRESSDGAGFVSEARPPSRVGGRRQRKYLYRDMPIEPCVEGLVHLTHATGTDEAVYAKNPELHPGGKAR